MAAPHSKQQVSNAPPGCQDSQPCSTPAIFVAPGAGALQWEQCWLHSTVAWEQAAVEDTRPSPQQNAKNSPNGSSTHVWLNRKDCKHFRDLLDLIIRCPLQAGRTGKHSGGVLCLRAKGMCALPAVHRKSMQLALTEKGSAANAASGVASWLPGKVSAQKPFLDALARFFSIDRGLNTAGPGDRSVQWGCRSCRCHFGGPAAHASKQHCNTTSAATLYP